MNLPRRRRNIHATRSPWVRVKTNMLMKVSRMVWSMVLGPFSKIVIWVSNSWNILMISIQVTLKDAIPISDCMSLVSPTINSLLVSCRRVSRSQMSLPRVSKLVFPRLIPPSSIKTSWKRLSITIGEISLSLSASCIQLFKKEESSVLSDGVSPTNLTTLIWRPHFLSVRNTLTTLSVVPSSIHPISPSIGKLFNTWFAKSNMVVELLMIWTENSSRSTVKNTLVKRFCLPKAMSSRIWVILKTRMLIPAPNSNTRFLKVPKFKSSESTLILCLLLTLLKSLVSIPMPI
mmetsp:Transcript_28827/g.26109  ORF Transcript_28827/g.26109 Transcript_28827/m.26109 type:complete len:289 (-) Transcript_28827:338-1204(-)